MCHSQYNRSKYKSQWQNKMSFVKCKCATWRGTWLLFTRQTKSRHVFLNSAKNAHFSLSSVCGSISADKTLLGGGTDVAQISIWASYPCAASHSRCPTRDTPHSPHSEGLLSSSGPRQWHSTGISRDAAFTQVTCVCVCVCVWQRDKSQVLDLWVHQFPLCFNNLPQDSHTHSFKTQRGMLWRVKVTWVREEVFTGPSNQPQISEAIISRSRHLNWCLSIFRFI